MFRLSPSSLNMIEECPRCFWLQIVKGIRRPEGIFPSLPSGMDRILKTHFDSFRDKVTLPPELAKNGILQSHAKLFSNAALLEEWRDNRRGLQWKTDDVFVRGAVDNLLETPEGKIIVLDYKTRGYPLKEDTAHHYQDQMNMYNFLLRKNGYQTEDFAYLMFYHPDQVAENGEFLFFAELVKVETSVDHAQQLIDLAVRTLSGDIPEASAKCTFCAWKKTLEGADLSTPKQGALTPKTKGKKGVAKQLTLG